jgi:hypothetical protein
MQTGTTASLMSRAGAGLALLLALVQAGFAYESGRAGFTVAVNADLVVSYRVFTLYVLPGEELDLTAGDQSATATADSGKLTRRVDGAWHWTAPAEVGLAVLSIRVGSDEIRLNALVLHPATRVEDGSLFGYRIGDYPEPLNGDPVYLPPDGFIPLTEDLLELPLSPHFRLGQFPSKQSTDLPKYLILREALLLKLELLLEELNVSGVEADTFTIMSGYRTPMYNRAIGNGDHSRHIYGGAADIYVDVSPRDDIMDDLNGDGVSDYRDAQWLYRLADALFGRPEFGALRGGLGVYQSNAAHGPFLHVDARGHRARWGLLP